MKRLLLEGTEEQIQNLKELYRFVDNELPEIKEGYQTANLWHINDVMSLFEYSPDQAMGVLEDALENKATLDQIWEAISIHGKDAGLRKVLYINKDVYKRALAHYTSNVDEIFNEVVEYDNWSNVIVWKPFQNWDIEDVKELVDDLYQQFLELKTTR